MIINNLKQFSSIVFIFSSTVSMIYGHSITSKHFNRLIDSRDKGVTNVTSTNEENIYDNQNYSRNLATVRLHKKGWEQGDPVLLLNSAEQLEIRFDVFESQLTNYQYRIYHCNRNWEKSNLSEMEYLNGFNDNYIEFHSYSFNTMQPYIHYAQIFPNEQISLTKSGNYILIVYPEGNVDEPILTRRFYVTEETAKVKATIRYPANVEERYYKQEVDFDIFINPSDVFNPYDNIKVDLEQNHRSDNGVYDLVPNFVRDNQMIYNYDEKNVFEAGNEFRHLDLTTTRSRTAQIYKYETTGDTVNGYMNLEINRQFQKYLQYGDINGRYVIKDIDGTDTYVQSQYVLTHLILPYPTPLTSGDIYVFGELSDWRFKPQFKMIYNENLKAYTANIYLKQGFYNYNYVYVGKNSTVGLMNKIEGTHFDTENEYVFRVYYSDPQQSYDRLLGYHIANSRDNF